MGQIEEWRPVKGYEGYYEVSSLGRVANLNYKKRGNRRLKVPRQFRNGYYYVDLYKDGKAQRFTVHRLVAMTFIPNPNNLPEVDHIDTDRTNNMVDNLRWVTNRDNHLNIITRMRCSAAWSQMWKDGKMDGNKKCVVQLTREGNFIREWESASKAAEFIGAPPVGVIRVCLGKRKHCRGYKWLYKEDYDNRNAAKNE